MKQVLSVSGRSSFLFTFVRYYAGFSFYYFWSRPADCVRM